MLSIHEIRGLLNSMEKTNVKMCLQTFLQNLNHAVRQTVINSKHSSFHLQDCLQSMLVRPYMYLCRTQLPAVLLAGQSCQCRCKVSLPLREQFPSFWMRETCMQLPEAVVLFFLQPPLIKICPNSSQPAEKPPPHISVPRRPRGRWGEKKVLECRPVKENSTIHVCN